MSDEPLLSMLRKSLVERGDIISGEYRHVAPYTPKPQPRRIDRKFLLLPECHVNPETGNMQLKWLCRAGIVMEWVRTPAYIPSLSPFWEALCWYQGD